MKGAIRMAKVLSIILGIVLTITSYYGFAEKYQLVSEGGKTDWRIVISDTASPSEKYAASELQKFLKEISGAELPIVTDKEPMSEHEIILGDNVHLRQLDVKIDFEKLGIDGCIIRTVRPDSSGIGGSLIIAGSKKQGTLYGVYTFLDRYLGCRWFTMIPDEVSRIPRVNQIEIGEIDWTQIPALKYRHIAPSDGYEYWGRNKLNKDIYTSGLRHWTKELGGGITEYEGHTFYQLVPPDKYFKEHPEYYSEIDGKRVIKNPHTGETAELCLTNPDVLRIATEAVKEHLRNPEIDIMSVSQMDDTSSYCRCANCRAIDDREGTPMGSILTFVNKIAEEIEKEFPDKAISTFSYTYSAKPPKTIRPRKNVIIYIAPIGACFSHTMEECEKNAKYKEYIEGWHKLGANIFILDYAAQYRHYLLSFTDLGTLKKNVQFYARNGAVGIFSKGDMATPETLLRVYILSRLFVDPNYDIDIAENEFLNGYYGKAAGLMRQYLDMLNDKIRKDNLHFGCGAELTAGGLDGVSMPLNTLLTPEVVSRAEKLFDEAEKLIAGDNEKLLHVQYTRLGIWYFKISTMALSDPKRNEVIAKFLDVIKESPVSFVQEGRPMEEYIKGIEQSIDGPNLSGNTVFRTSWKGDKTEDLSGFPASNDEKENANQTTCAFNLKQIGRAAYMYTLDYGEWTVPLVVGDFPKMKSWRTLLYPYVKNPEVFVCPATPTLRYIVDALKNNTENPWTVGSPGGYAINGVHSQGVGYPLPPVGNGGGINVSRIIDPSDTIWFMDAAPISDEFSFWSDDGVKEWRDKTHGKTRSDSNGLRHSGGANYLFCDGHVKWLRPTEIICSDTRCDWSIGTEKK